MVRNKHLAGSIADVGWGNFRRMLEYKTKWYGSRLIVMDRWYPSSKKCSCCGEINHDLRPIDKIWSCARCGAVHDRDENAAKNICQYGLDIINTESSSGIYACGQNVSPSEMKAVLVEAGSKQSQVSDKTYGTVGEPDYSLNAYHDLDKLSIC
jgi:putative transposase